MRATFRNIFYSTNNISLPG